MRKIVFGIVVVAVVALGYYGVIYFKTPTTTNYNELLQHNVIESMSAATNSGATASVPAVSLNDMLGSGIGTSQGILKSVQDDNELKPYYLSLNDKALKIRAVTPIVLVKAFLIGGNQILLFAFNQGGNQCDYQYQFLTISANGKHLSNVFGSCLKITTLENNESAILITMP